MYPRTDPAYRPWAWLGICAIVAALAWPAQPAAAAARQGTDTISLATSSVDASETVPLAFDFAASGNDQSTDDTVTITIPQGWTVSSPDLACPRVCQLVSSTSTAIAVYINLDDNQTFELDVTATAPASAMTSTFTTSEQFADPSSTVVLPSPQVTVNCPDDGTGAVTVSPVPPSSPVTAGRIMNFVLTYQAGGACGVGVGGVVTLTVPDTWTAPSSIAGTPGYTMWSGLPLSISDDGTITVPVGTLGPGATISVDYDMVQVPGAGEYMFGAAEQSSMSGTLTPLAPAMVDVMPSTLVTTPPPTPSPSVGGTGQPAVTPSRVTTSPSVTVIPTRLHARGPASSSTLSWLLTGLAAVACMAGVLALRRLRRARRLTAGSNVRAVPHTGPPATVAIHDTGTRPTLIVRIEPHASDSVTTLEEARR